METVRNGRRVLHLAISRYNTAAITSTSELMEMLKKASPEIKTLAIRQESKLKLFALSPPV